MVLNYDQVISDLHQTQFGNLQAFFYRNIKNQAIAKDLAQDVFLRLCRYKQKLPSKSSEQIQYIWTIAKNVLRDHWKNLKQNQHLQAVDYSEEVISNIRYEDSVEEKHLLEQNLTIAFAALTKNLSKLQAKAFLLRYQNRWSIEKIALHLNTREGVITKRLCDSRKKLKIQFGMERWTKIYQAIHFRINKPTAKLS